MTRTIEVEMDDSGTVRPMDPAASLPRGRAVLVWQTKAEFQTGMETMLLSEVSLAVDWMKPEENEAWAYLQPDRF